MNFAMYMNYCIWIYHCENKNHYIIYYIKLSFRVVFEFLSLGPFCFQ